MPVKNDERKKELLKYCSKNFYPYIDEVLERIPEKVRDKDIINDTTLKIVSFEPKELFGQHFLLEPHAKHLIILNESLLEKQKFLILHTIAHEIAHKIVGGGGTNLHEKEAEDLIVKWGFKKESEQANYQKPIMEDAGYRAGYEWAKRQDDLSDYEEFYDEWSEDNLSLERLEELLYYVDEMSIYHELYGNEEGENQKEEAEEVSPNDFSSLSRGVVGGIMGYIKEEKEKRKR